MTARRDTSADSAARFLARPVRSRTPAKPGCRRCGMRGHYAKTCPTLPRRIDVDFAEPTLRLIHEVLCDRILAADMILDRLNLLLSAEQMVATALGDPPCDDPPLSDRGVP